MSTSASSHPENRDEKTRESPRFQPQICIATEIDLHWLKSLADEHKHELGFVRRGALLRSIEAQCLLTAQYSGAPLGFVQFHHRRDGQTTIYNIVVARNSRGSGVGKALLSGLRMVCITLGQHRIVLKTPVDLPANRFYETVGFVLAGQEAGKARPLNIWRMEVLSHDCANLEERT
ncbi:MAG: GNAT family N-acetyltransferase [Chloroflexota bacterium]